ncbi:hypothetical protein ACQKQD_18880 [Methylobacterium sp. NPDC080182]|uniref:hypothetical protein n=1 Tax=Methylobacterium sp. NPDC080182 TaxID=3390590 RepID=UPI003CFC0444
MPALASPAAVEVIEDGARKTLDVAAIRYGAFASVSLTFDRRYRRGIQLTRRQLLDHAHRCLAVADQLSQEA